MLVDTTIEKMAYILSRAAPKGLLSFRDELSGWLQGLNAYNPQGRAFWLQSYGGRQYSQDRVKHGQEPIRIPHHAVALYGGVQPEKLSEMMGDADDGLLARILWSWPDPVGFRIGLRAPKVDWAITALDRLRELTMQPGRDVPEPILVLFEDEACKLLEAFGREIQGAETMPAAFFAVHMVANSGYAEDTFAARILATLKREPPRHHRARPSGMASRGHHRMRLHRIDRGDGRFVGRKRPPRVVLLTDCSMSDNGMRRRRTAKEPCRSRK